MTTRRLACIYIQWNSFDFRVLKQCFRLSTCFKRFPAVTSCRVRNLKILKKITLSLPLDAESCLCIWVLFVSAFYTTFVPLLTSSSAQCVTWTTQPCLFAARIPCPSLWQNFHLLHSSASHPVLLPSPPQVIPFSSPVVVSRQTQSQCAPDAPPPPPTPLTPPHPHSLSLLTLCSIQTDGIAISPGFTPRLSRCLPHSTLSILSSSFLSLTKWKISRERENGWKEREREREPTYGPKPRVFLSDILSNVLSL